MSESINIIELNELLESIRLFYGYDFTEYAESSMKRRIIHFMKNRKIETLGKLKKILLQDKEYFERFIRDVTVTVTEMFRDPPFYKSLRETTMKRLATYPTIKIWIAGCATGEEAYSIAIVLKEEDLLERSIIYATDINQDSIYVAKAGVYSTGSIEIYTNNYANAGGKSVFSEYYISKQNAVVFEKSLQQHILFLTHNLVIDKSFNEFQLIICRNVLLYFNQQLQNRVINLFYDSLCRFGFLALGNKESLLFSDKRKYFSDVDSKEKIFMRNDKSS